MVHNDTCGCPNCFHVNYPDRPNPHDRGSSQFTHRPTTILQHELVELPPVTRPIGATPDYTTIIRRDLENFEGEATQLHHDVVELIQYVSTLRHRDVEHNEALRLLLTRNTKGLDRQQLATWLEAHTPMKIRLERSGIRNLRVDSKKAARREAEGLPRWNIYGLKTTGWWEMERAVVIPPKAVSIDKARAEFAKLITKAAFEMTLKNPKLNAEGALEKALDEALKDAQSKLRDACLAYTHSEAFEDWAARREAQYQRERSEVTWAVAKEKEKRAAVLAEIGAALAETRSRLAS